MVSFLISQDQDKSSKCGHGTRPGSEPDSFGQDFFCFANDVVLHQDSVVAAQERKSRKQEKVKNGFLAVLVGEEQGLLVIIVILLDSFLIKAC